jgi:hypothetical protein
MKFGACLIMWPIAKIPGAPRRMAIRVSTFLMTETRNAMQRGVVIPEKQHSRLHRTHHLTALAEISNTENPFHQGN